MRSFTALVNPISGGGCASRSWAPLAERIGDASAFAQWSRSCVKLEKVCLTSCRREHQSGMTVS